MLESMAERWNPTSKQLVLAGADDADLIAVVGSLDAVMGDVDR